MTSLTGFSQITTVITTIAGTGTPAFSGDGAAATLANINKPNSVAVDRWGNVYFMDEENKRVREVSNAGVIKTVAGNGTVGYSGDNGPATAAKICFATGVAVDSSGNVYIADYANQRIRKVNASGVITTFAGNGTAGYTGDGVQATATELWSPWGVCFDKQQNLYIADYYNYCIRKVSPAGIISTVAGSHGSSGNTGDGGPATLATLNEPRGVAVDNAGNIYIADGANNRVRKVDAATGIISNFAGSEAGTSGTYSGDGGQATAAILYYPTAVAVDDSGYVYITDVYNNRVRAVAPDGIIKTVMGTGAGGYNMDNIPGTAAEINNPMGVAVDSIGNIYVADYFNSRVRKMSPIHCVPHGGTISGSAYVSSCSPGVFTATIPGGTWSVSGGHTTFTSYGTVHYVSAGTDSVFYTVVDTCGTVKVATTIQAITTPQYDSMGNIHGKKYICIGYNTDMIDSVTGGTWALVNGKATITSAGVATGVTAGADTVEYTFTDSCGTQTRKYAVWVLAPHPCDSANSVPGIPGQAAGRVSIFPNPASATLSVQLTDDSYNSFILTNNLGQVILRRNITTSSLDLDVHQLPAGIYYLLFSGSGGSEAARFLKD